MSRASVSFWSLNSRGFTFSYSFMSVTLFLKLFIFCFKSLMLFWTFVFALRFFKCCFRQALWSYISHLSHWTVTKPSCLGYCSSPLLFFVELRRLVDLSWLLYKSRVFWNWLVQFANCLGSELAGLVVFSAHNSREINTCVRQPLRCRRCD